MVRRFDRTTHRSRTLWRGDTYLAPRRKRLPRTLLSRCPCGDPRARACGTFSSVPRREEVLVRLLHVRIGRPLYAKRWKEHWFRAKEPASGTILTGRYLFLAFFSTNSRRWSRRSCSHRSIPNPSLPKWRRLRRRSRLCPKEKTWGKNLGQKNLGQTGRSPISVRSKNRGTFRLSPVSGSI